MPNIENTSPHSLQLPELWKPECNAASQKEKDFTKDPKLGVSQQNSSSRSSYNEAHSQQASPCTHCFYFVMLWS